MRLMKITENCARGSIWRATVPDTTTKQQQYHLPLEAAANDTSVKHDL